MDENQNTVAYIKELRRQINQTKESFFELVSLADQALDKALINDATGQTKENIQDLEQAEAALKKAFQKADLMKSTIHLLCLDLSNHLHDLKTKE